VIDMTYKPFYLKTTALADELVLAALEGDTEVTKSLRPVARPEGLMSSRAPGRSLRPMARPGSISDTASMVTEAIRGAGEKRDRLRRPDAPDLGDGEPTEDMIAKYRAYIDEVKEFEGELKEYKPKPRSEGAYSEELGRFGSRLRMSESSNNYQEQIQLTDGRYMTGAFQFGDARLSEYKNDTGESFTRDEFKNDNELQNKVFKWHIADIDNLIDRLDAEGYSRDGLRAVAHLGGKTGMMKFVKTRGGYNPSDAFGTRLSDYYNKFK